MERSAVRREIGVRMVKERFAETVGLRGRFGKSAGFALEALFDFEFRSVAGFEWKRVPELQS
jgi:hypothetical protein